MTTDQKIKQCLHKFGFDNFRSEIQEKAILAVIKGTNDVFISLPTGAGKYVFRFYSFNLKKKN